MSPARAALLIPLLAVAVLPGCLPSGLSGGRIAATDPTAPTGVDRGEAVDGLTVGHRLMEAGEYELALRAYYRAAAEQGPTADVLSAIGSADLRLGRLGQAEQMLRRALDLDDRFVPAWNNLGVVLMEQGEAAEASRVFQTAYALDNGNSDQIRENLRLALARIENPAYTEDKETTNYKLVRRGYGEYLLLGPPPEAEL